MSDSTATTPTADERRTRLDAAFGRPETKQLNTRVSVGLAENLAFVAKLTGETSADIVVAAVQAAVDERLARPEIRQKLEELLDRSKSVVA